MAYFRHSNIDFYFEEYGSGSALILSHGLGRDLVQMRELVSEPENLRVVLYDNRAHGRTSSAGDPQRLTFSEMADDVAALMDNRDIPAAVVGGISMGAGIALAFGRRHRSRTRALVLGRPAWLNTPHPPNLSILSTIADLIEKHGCMRGLSLFQGSDAYGSLKECFPYTAESLIRLFSTQRPEAMVLALRFIPRSTPFESYDQLRDLKIPSLVLANRNDPMHPFEYAQRWAASIPFAKLCELPSKSESLEQHRRKFRLVVSEFVSSVC
jgi:pimeloyl-ACP methyl ester carboxylesterase